MVRQVLAKLNIYNNQNYLNVLEGCRKRPGSLMVRHWSYTPSSREHPGSIPGQGAYTSFWII